MSSLRDLVAEQHDSTEELVTVDEWKHPQTGEPLTFLVKSMTGGTRAKMVMSSRREDGEGTDFSKLYPAIIIATCYDPETGEKVFQDDDVELLNSKRASVVEKLGSAGMRVSGLRDEDATEEGKDSSSSPSDEPGSSSPDDSG